MERRCVRAGGSRATAGAQFCFLLASDVRTGGGNADVHKGTTGSGCSPEPEGITSSESARRAIRLARPKDRKESNSLRWFYQ